jgi:hypothetical protein
VTRFLDITLGFPSKSTLIKANNMSHLNTLPGLMAENVSNFFPDSDETQKGPTKQQYQGR